jgi:hypothetical protein
MKNLKYPSTDEKNACFFLQYKFLMCTRLSKYLYLISLEVISLTVI